MFTLIESRKEIAQAQRILESTILRDFRSSETRDIGYPGGTRSNEKVFTDESYWFLSADHKGNGISNPKQLNFFGVYKKQGSLQISVEINTTYEGSSNSVAGFFARDNSTGSIYLMHSGRVAGGTRGVKKENLLAWSNLRPVDVLDASGKVRDGIIVMPIEGVSASRSAIRYIETIAQFKQAVRDGALDEADFENQRQALKDFYAEARGRRKGRRSSTIDYLSRHGDVVDALETWRKARPLPKSGRIVKNIFIDMAVAIGDKVVEIFEVKTNTNRQSLYTAIGQLMVHGIKPNCRRVVVLPDGEGIPSDVEKALHQQGIELLTFQLDSKQAIIL